MISDSETNHPDSVLDEPFSGWTPEGLGSAIRTTNGDLQPHGAQRHWRVVAAALGLVVALLAATAIGVIQIFGDSGRARRSRQQ